MFRMGLDKISSISSQFVIPFQEALAPFVSSLLRMCDDSAPKCRLGNIQVASSLSSGPDSSSCLQILSQHCFEEEEAVFSKFDELDLYPAS